jgi:hypothetical protein
MLGTTVSISSQRASVASYCYVVPSLLILFTLMKDSIRSSETPIPTRATPPHIPEHGILQLSICRRHKEDLHDVIRDEALHTAALRGVYVTVPSRNLDSPAGDSGTTPYSLLEDNPSVEKVQ